MEQLLKPERFDVLPTVAEADAKWIHWKRTFTNFTNKICDGTQESKLSLLCNYISAAVFLHIAEATCYSDAISILDSTYLVKKNDTFARHLLAIRNQQVSETVNDFLQALNQLSRNCDFRAVTAEQYRGEFIRDAFIRGLKYGNIRDHLLGNASSNNLEDAVNQAKTLELLESSSIKAHHKPQEKDVIQSHQIACVKIANAYHYPQHISSIADVNQNHQNFFNTKNAFPEQHDISTSVYNNQENFCSLVNVFEKHPKSSNTTENGIQLPCRMVNVNSGRQNNYNSENVVHDPPQRETQCKKRTKCTVNINFDHQNVNRTENVFQVPPEITNVPQCNKKPIIIKEHQLIQDGNCFKCGVCEKRFESKRGLRRHLHVHEEGYVKVNHYLNKMTEEERKEKRYGCEICHKKFGQSSDLRRHIVTHTGEKPYVCHICERRFTQQATLAGHILVHIGEMPYSCETCHKRFAQKHQLNKHSVLHDRDKWLPCMYCDKKFPRKYQLEKHLVCHEGPYLCKYCDEEFIGAGIINEHILIHPKEWRVCKTCGKEFKNKCNFKTHCHIHSEAKRYVCEVCHKGFNQTANLRAHKRTHTGEKLYACNVCDKRFTAKSTLQGHMLIHTGEKPHVCSVCDKRFGLPRSLRRHMEVHSDEKSYFTCEFCDKKFRLRVSLHKHFLTHTKKVTKRKTKTAELIESSSNERENSHESESY